MNRRPRFSSGGYSKDFKPHGNTGRRYLLDQIPAGFWTAVQEKAKREKVSLRALILRLLTDWLADDVERRGL